MKKVGILTINDYTNYGNRLQNYAVQEVIEEMGLEANTITNTTKINKNVSNLSKSKVERHMETFRKLSINGIIKKTKLRLISTRMKKMLEMKELNFRVFSKKYIKETEFEIEFGKVPNDLGEKYDFFVTGSDQVWNPTYKRFSELDFLTFAPKEKRIAYSPSFAISQLPYEYKIQIKGWLEGMNHLSVREDAGARIIKELTGRESDVLIDPTMMLERDKWVKISKEHNLKPKVPYMCTYFLGDTYDAHKKSIYRIAKSKNLEVVNLGSIYDLDRYSIDPSEFIDYIASSEIFLTDSFHGTIFSIIFEKPFIVYDRIGKLESMSSRIDTLLVKFNMMERKWESVKQSQDYFGADFSHTGPIFEYEKSKAHKYLRKAFDLGDAK